MERLRPGQDGRHVTFCRICDAFCGLTADVQDGRIVKVGPDRDNPHSQGHICIKGPSMLAVTYDPDRVTQPLRRVGAPGNFEPVSWDEALTDIASRLATIYDDHGPEAIASFHGNPGAYNISGQFSFKPFLDRLGVWKQYSSASQDTTSRAVASYALYGSSIRRPLPDLPRCDFLIIVGANPLVSHGSVLTAPRIREDLDAIAQRGRVVVVDPRLTETAERFEHIAVRPAGDVWMLAYMVKTLFDEGLEDLAFLERHTVGARELRSALGQVTAERVRQECGVEPETIAALARDFAAAPRAALYSRVGICRGPFSTLANVLVDCVNIIAGKFAVPGGWVFGNSPLNAEGRPGGYTLRPSRLGPMPIVIGYAPFNALAEEILTSGDGQVRAFFVTSGNPVLSAPGPERLQAAFESLELMVSFDIYLTETNRFADYILPTTTFFEREDLPVLGFPNMVRPFAQYAAPVIPPVGEARSEHIILSDLVARLGALTDRPLDIAPFDPLAALDGLLRTGRWGQDGLSIERLKAAPHGVALADNIDVSGWEKQMRHEDGRIRLWDDLIAGEFDRLWSSPPADAEGLRLFGRRELRSMNSWMHNVDRLVRQQSPVLQMHPDDAARHGIGHGSRAVVRSKAGSMEVDVSITDAVTAGSVCYPHGWEHDGGWQRANATGGHNVNVLADPAAAEVVSGSSFLDGIEVTVTPLTPADA
ncbi:molybdopterin-dependent oxidoreductase [Phenylobacterium sp.]|uniref:molybdopterin-containing oxidoreductase family protein n=1 Tax=Phenylobacterium sp. TaxID=1871053 RepID=UPI00301C81B5